MPRALERACAAMFLVAACADVEHDPEGLELGSVELRSRRIAGEAPVGRFPRIVSNGGALVAFTAGDPSEATLALASPSGDGWGTPVPVAQGAGWFVNWADCPAVARDPGGATIASWLVRNGESPYAYEVTFATSAAPAEPFCEPSVLHDDRSEAEHGFVSLVPLEAGWSAVWLDGRNTGGGHGHHDGAGAMTLATRTIGPRGELGQEVTLDERVCDCCPTDAVRLEDDTVVVVYRDRGEDELRDIGLVRGHPEDPSSWSTPRIVHPDGWIMPGCPVNGPAVAANGQRVGVAWFTLGATGRPRVLAALSADGGATFAAPLEIDEGDPIGRVDVAFVPVPDSEDDALLVTWLEQTDEGAEWCARTLSPGANALGPVLAVAEAAPGRESGALRIARSETGAWAVWTDTGSDPARVLAAELRPITR